VARGGAAAEVIRGRRRNTVSSFMCVTWVRDPAARGRPVATARRRPGRQPRDRACGGAAAGPGPSRHQPWCSHDVPAQPMVAASIATFDARDDGRGREHRRRIPVPMTTLDRPSWHVALRAFPRGATHLARSKLRTLKLTQRQRSFTGAALPGCPLVPSVPSFSI
jgi:hypothetical protein